MSAELIAEITAGLAKVIGENSGFGSVLKFDYEGAGVTRVDGKSVPNTVTNEDKPADATVTISWDDFVALSEGRLDGMMAFMQGKLKIAGDMMIAQKLPALLKR